MKIKMRNMRQKGLLLLVVVMLLLVTGCSGNDRIQEGSRSFDFYIDMTTKDDIDTLSDRSFVEGIFPFSVMTFQRPGYENPMNGQMALLIASSFENLNVSPYLNLIDEDPDILQDSSRNPILISNDLAQAEKLSVGGIFYQETKASDEPMSFTVAGIFRQEPLFAQFEAIALLNNQITRIFSEKVDELGYTNAYIKAADLTALKSYLDDDFIPHLLLKGLSAEDIDAIAREDLKCNYEEYSAHMNRMK